MLERYGGRDDIAGRQIDNEFGCHETTLSYDTSTLQRFRSWLGDHYESIEGLNDAWSTVFWSQEYPGFDAIGFPRQAWFDETTKSRYRQTGHPEAPRRRCRRKFASWVDIVSPEADLADYRVVLVPALFTLDVERPRRFEDCNAEVLFGPRSGSRTSDFSMPHNLAPGCLQQVLAVDSIRAGDEIAFSYAGEEFAASHWLESKAIWSRRQSPLTGTTCISSTIASITSAP